MTNQLKEQTIKKSAYFSAKKLAYGGLLLALSLVLPMLFHLTGVAQSGAVFLPMHIPVILSGFILGPIFGLVIGIAAPIISFFTTGMPPLARLPFMIGELAAYGLVSGLLYHTLGFYRRQLGIYVTLILSMIAGRGVYALFLIIAGPLLGINVGSVSAVWVAIITGAAGIVIQLFFIPPIIYALKKGGQLSDFINFSQKNIT